MDPPAPEIGSSLCAPPSERLFLDVLLMVKDELRDILDDPPKESTDLRDRLDVILNAIEDCTGVLDAHAEPVQSNESTTSSRSVHLFHSFSRSPSPILMPPDRAIWEDIVRQQVDAVHAPNFDDSILGDVIDAHPANNESQSVGPEGDTTAENSEDAVAALLRLQEDSVADDPDICATESDTESPDTSGVINLNDPKPEDSEPATTEADLSMAMGNLGIQDSSTYIEDAVVPSTIPIPSPTQRLSLPPHPSFTAFDLVATIIRCVGEELQQDERPKTYLGALTRNTPPVPDFLIDYNPAGSRKVREGEWHLPQDARLDAVIPFEGLGDMAEHVVYISLLLAGDPDAPLNADAFTQAVRDAFEGKAEASGLGKLLDDDAHLDLRSVQRSMDGIKTFSREADVEFHFRSIPGKIMSIVMNKVAPEREYYIRSGSKGQKGDADAAATSKGTKVSTGNSYPDLEGVRRHGPDVASILDSVPASICQSVQDAVELKPKLTLTNVTTCKIIHVRITKNDLSDLEALEDQVRRCPGYAYRFVWPEQGVNLSVSDAMIVQVFTAMHYKKLLFYELSSSNRSIFFWRLSLDSTALYFSRIYNMAEDIEDPRINAIDCKTNLTRFAMRYLAGNEDLQRKFAKLVPPPKKDHWAAAVSPGPLSGVDTSTSWKYGKKFYVDPTEKVDPIAMRRSDRVKRQKGPVVRYTA